MAETGKESSPSRKELKKQRSSLAPVSIRTEGDRSFKVLLAILVGMSACFVFIENGLHPGFLIFVPLIVWTVLRKDYRRALIGSETILTIAFVCYAVILTILMIMIRKRFPIPLYLAYFTFGVVLARALGPLTDRNLGQLIFLSLGLILINCVLSNHVIFGILLPIYFFVFMATLYKFHLAKHRRSPGMAAAEPEENTPRRRWQLNLAKYAVAMVILAAIMFVFLPRPFTVFPALRAAMATGASLADLSRQISYGDMLGMAGRNRIAFLVRFRDQAPTSPPYWRGRVLDQTDGYRWFMSRRMRLGDTFYRRHSHVETMYEILPVRLQSRSVYVYGLPTAVYEKRGTPVPINRMGEVVVDSPFLVSDSYTVYAIQEPLKEDFPRNPRFVDTAGVTEQLAKVASEWTAGATTPKEKADAIMARFQRDFSYELEPVPPPAGDHPLEYFLLKGRKGNCQHFAGSMALLLRSVGVPSRVAEGFLGMEPTDTKGEYLVRFAAAHAWVEAILDGQHWTRLDPTPPDPNRLFRSIVWNKLNDIYDRAEYSWIKMVVNFDRTDQRLIFKRITGLFSGDASLRSLLPSGTKGLIIAAIAALILAAVAVLIIRQRIRAGNDLSALYMDTMKALAKKGVLTEVHSWHEQNTREVEKRAPQARASFSDFMQAYLQSRFRPSAGVSRQELLKLRDALFQQLERPHLAG